MKKYLILFLMIFLLTGCSSKTISVSGKISLDGTPLPSGSIGFTGDSGAGSCFGTQIVNGKWSVRLPPDNYRVCIDSIQRVKLDKPYRDNQDVLIEYTNKSIVPSKYNENSKLIIEVSKDKRVHDFELENSTPNQESPAHK